MQIDNQERDFDDKQLFSKLVNKWVNGKNDEGFTPIHYASYRGNIKIIIELEMRGANLSEINNQGKITFFLQGNQLANLYTYSNFRA